MRLLPLRSASLDPARNLAYEECLLEALAPASPLLFLFVDGPCVVIGRNQNPWMEAAPAWQGRILRRVSGGGAVWHDEGNLNWALLLPRASHDQEAELALVAKAISSLGAEVLPGPRGGLYTGPGTRLPGAKVSGTARRLTARAVLHHGTLLVSADLAALGCSLGGLAPVSSRALPSAPSAVANLADLVPGLDAEGAAKGLALALCGALPGPVEDLVAEAELLEPMARHESWAWVYGETPAFTASLEAWPGTRLEVRRGRVEAVRGPGAENLAGLVGKAFEPSLLSLGRPQGK
jgi:lipoate-protein ligase A